MVASKIILFSFLLNCESPCKEDIYSAIAGQGFKIRNSQFYTIHKIVATVRKVLEVQKIVCSIFDFQTART